MSAMAYYNQIPSITTNSKGLQTLAVVACGLVCASIGYIVLSHSLGAVHADGRAGFMIAIVVGLLALLGMGTVHAFYVGHRKATEEIANIHRIDFVTGLLSRAGLEHEINKFVETDAVNGGLTRAYLISLEFDSLKDINEVYGHDVGDTIIKVLAERLKKIVGDLGPVGRLSGSEYVIAFTAGTHERELKIAVDTLIESMSQPIRVGGVSMAVFGNAGVVRLHQSKNSLESALRCATLARSSARAAGRGTWSIYHPEMSQIAAYRKWLESELSSALQRGEFALNYQPQVDASTGAIIGYEALLRWTHHDKGAIPPGEFIEIAEQCGLIRPIGNWVLQKACSDAMQLPDHMTMSVNVSSVQIMDIDFIDNLKRILRSTGLPPKRLELEVTESVVITDFKTVRERFAQVHEMGCAVAIDDFGTGYSNLTNLSELPFEKLKIDKSFIDRLVNQKKMGSIVSTIVNLANSMGAKAIAEGVESVDQAELLARAGCTLIQGYYFSKPLTLAQAQAFGSSIHHTVHSSESVPAQAIIPPRDNFASAQAEAAMSDAAAHAMPNQPPLHPTPSIVAGMEKAATAITPVAQAPGAAVGTSSFEKRLARIATG